MDIRKNTGNLHGKLALWIAATAIALGFVGVLPALTEAGSAAANGWYRAPLEHGEIHGYHWGVRATGPKDEPLRRICEVIGRVAPFDPDLGYGEADETKSCGKLLKPTDSVSMSVTLGSSESMTTLLATIYRPIVRKVVLVLGTGEERVYRTAAVNVAGRASKGIPLFRYLVAFFDQGSCIRRIVTHDGQGGVINNEKAEPGCTAS